MRLLSPLVSPLPRRRLEDRIRTLLAQAVAARDPTELSTVFCQLRAELHEHTTRLRKLAFIKLNPKSKHTIAEGSATDDMAAD